MYNTYESVYTGDMGKVVQSITQQWKEEQGTLSTRGMLCLMSLTVLVRSLLN